MTELRAVPGPPPAAGAPAALPVLDPAATERADAARNRHRILDAAERLIDERGVEAVSMDAVARAACVGKGTLFRRFGDRATLLRTLLDERERRLQDAFIRGAPPLGPGAPARERLVAFAGALLDHVERHGDLLAAAESGRPGLRLRHPVYAAHHAHVSVLLREADPSLDADCTADLILAALGADTVLHLRRVRGWPRERILAGVTALIDRLAGPA